MNNDDTEPAPRPAERGALTLSTLTDDEQERFAAALRPLYLGTDALIVLEQLLAAREARGWQACAELDQVVGSRLAEVDVRIARLEDVEARWDVPGGSRRLAQRARDKAEGLKLARRIITGR